MQDELELGVYNYGFRNYDPALGRWFNIDALSEKYYSSSPYGFVNNNPILNREIDGRWFNEKKAQRYEKQLDKKIGQLNKEMAKLHKNGQKTGDLGDRIAELTKSKTDISDMRGALKEDGGKEYRFEKATSKNGHGNGTNSTVGDGNVVTMFVGKDTALGIHEIRHGGQDARNEYDASNASKTGYGVTEEVDSYKAQYSFSGGFSYNSHNFDQTLNNMVSRTYLDNGMVPPTAKVNVSNISGVTPAMVNDIGTYFSNSSGSAVIPLYPPEGMTTTQVNSN